MEENRVTPVEALEHTICVLNGVTLPKGMTVAEAGPILVPVQAAIGNLEAIIKAIRMAEEQEGQEDVSGEQ